MLVGIVDRSATRSEALARLFETAGFETLYFGNPGWRRSNGAEYTDATGAKAKPSFGLVLVHAEDKDLWSGVNRLGADLYHYTGGWSFAEKQNAGAFLQRSVDENAITIHEARSLGEWIAAGRTGDKPRLLQPDEALTDALAAAALVCQTYLVGIVSAAPDEVHQAGVEPALSRMGWQADMRTTDAGLTRMQEADWWRTALGFDNLGKGIERFASVPKLQTILKSVGGQTTPTASEIASAYEEVCDMLETIG